jgi:hypothetical protein
MLNALAEAVRFELTKGVNPWQFSRLLPSTTRPRFQLEDGYNHVYMELIRLSCFETWLFQSRPHSTRTNFNRLVFPAPGIGHRYSRNDSDP